MCAANADSGAYKTDDDLNYCAKCRTEIWAEAEKCPSFGHWILRKDRRDMVWERPELRWVKTVTIAILVIVALMISAGIFAMLYGVQQHRDESGERAGRDEIQACTAHHE